MSFVAPTKWTSPLALALLVRVFGLPSESQAYTQLGVGEWWHSRQHKIFPIVPATVGTINTETPEGKKCLNQAGCLIVSFSQKTIRAKQPSFSSGKNGGRVNNFIRPQGFLVSRLELSFHFSRLLIPEIYRRILVGIFSICQFRTLAAK